MKLFITFGILLFPMIVLSAPAANVSYHPVNLLDNNPTTLWCAHYREGGVRVQLQLSRSRSVDRVVLMRANRGAKAVDVVHISRDGHGYDVSLTDGPGDVSLSPTRTRTLTVTVREVSDSGADASLGADVFCLSDIALYDHGEPVDMTEVTVAPERLAEQVVGGWQREGASRTSSVLTFNLDGTWQMTPARGKRLLKGTYQLGADRILMRRPGRRSTQLVAQVDRVAISGISQENEQDTYSILVVRGTGDAKIDGKYVVRGGSGI